MFLVCTRRKHDVVSHSERSFVTGIGCRTRWVGHKSSSEKSWICPCFELTLGLHPFPQVLFAPFYNYYFPQSQESEFSIGGSKAWRWGCALPPTTPVQFLSFSCSFPQKSFQTIGFRHKLGTWIRQCSELTGI